MRHLIKTKFFPRPVPCHHHIWDPLTFYVPTRDQRSFMGLIFMTNVMIVKRQNIVLAIIKFGNWSMFLFQVDLEGLRTVSSDRGRAMAAELGLPYFETSAATGQGDLLQITYSHSVLVFIKHETCLRIIHFSRC